MSKLLSLFLIIALSFQCFMKVGIISYYNLNIDYIIKELCENKSKPELKCNGKCFLKKKMSEADKSEKESKEIIKQIEFAVVIPQTISLRSVVTLVIENSPAELVNFYSHNPNARIFHPPLI